MMTRVRFCDRQQGGGYAGFQPCTSSTRRSVATGAFATPQGTPLSVSAPGVPANDTTPTTPRNAARDGQSRPGAERMGRSYTPVAGYNGPDSFVYTANDGAYDSNLATVNLNVGSFNHPPIAVGDNFNVAKGTPLTVSAPGLLANDTDPEGNSLTAVLVSGPAHGSVVLNPNGSFTYTAAAGYNGPDSFTYNANDGTSSSSPATVKLNALGSISGRLWNDLNNDGQKPRANPGWRDAPSTLTRTRTTASMPARSDRHRSDGTYTFSNLALGICRGTGSRLRLAADLSHARANLQGCRRRTGDQRAQL